jgi:acetylornithine aminotransferase
MTAVMQTYARLPISFNRGEGVYLFDDAGRRYLDGIAGIGVNCLGHAHPAVVATIAEQAGKLIHTSNLYHIETQERLAAKLCQTAAMESCFFGNSGAEANEAAIKLARLYGHQRGVEKPTIVVLEGAFHGRTLATLSATGNRKIQAGFVRAPRNDIAALQQIAANNPGVVAVLMEPIQGEGGVHPLEADYLQAVQALCHEQQWLFMLDEVQTGNGRTGHYFACQGLGLQPDVITTAKGLGNGLPIGACLARGAAAAVLGAGQHGSTYGGNPLACATALTVMETLLGEGLLDNATRIGQLIRDQLEAELADDIVEFRGAGLMLGIELRGDCSDLVANALDAGLLVNVTAGNTLRLLPPLIISEHEATDLATGIVQVIKG